MSAQAQSKAHQPVRAFLSYATRDRQKAREVYRRLAQTEGVKPWFDEKILLPGTEWEQEIAAAVHATDVVVVCFSANSVAQNGKLDTDIAFALKRAEAREQNKPAFLLLRLEAGEIPDSVSDTISAWPSVNWSEKTGYEQLVDFIKKQPATGARTPEKPRAEKHPPPAPAPSQSEAKDAAQKPPVAAQGEPPSSKRPAAEAARRAIGAKPPAPAHPPRETEKPAHKTTKAAPAPARPTQSVQRGKTATPAPAEHKTGQLVFVLSLAVLLIALVVWQVFPALSKTEEEGQEGQTASQPTLSAIESSVQLVSPSGGGEGGDNATPGELPAPGVSLSPEPPQPPPSEPTPASSGDTLTRMLTSTDALTPTATPTITPTATPTITPTATPTITPTATPTITPTATPTITPTATPTITPTATLPPPPPEEPEPIVYTVDPGDTMRGIAQEYNVSVDAILELNGLSREEGDAIFPGQQLLIPR
jgi:LysM repeat protein